MAGELDPRTVLQLIIFCLLNYVLFLRFMSSLDFREDFYMPKGIKSSILWDLKGTAAPVYCLLHSHRSSNKPKGISQNSACER